MPGAGDAGHADELADRELDVDVLEVVHRGAADPEGAEVLVAPLGHRDLALAREELARDRPRVPLHGLRRALRDDVPAVLARARAHVDQVVGRAHHLLVVLDHEHGVAEVAQPLEGRDQLAVVALVEPDRGLVEDVEHADELAADLRGEAQPLGLAAGERRSRAVELQVADADVLEEGQPLADLLDDPLADQLLGLGQLEAVEELDRALNGQLRQLVDVLLADGDREHLGLEARAVADRAGPEAHVLLDPLALLARVGLAVAALEARDDPLEGEHVRPLAAHPVAVLDVDLVAVGAEEEEVLLLLGQLLPRQLEVDLVAVGDRLDDRLVEARVAERPGHERALADRERRVGHEQVGVDLLLGAEARAARAGAVRRVEREDARLELRQSRRRARGRRSSRENVSLLAVEHVDDDQALGERRRRLDRLREPLAQVGLHHEAVDDDLDRVLELLVEDDLGSSSRRCSPSTFTRVNPSARSSSKTSLYSPLRSRTTGALTVNLVPSGSWRIWSTIASWLWPAIGRPQTGQCGLPMRA